MIPSLDLPTLEGLSNALGHTSNGLSGKTLEKLLDRCGIAHQPIELCQSKKAMLFDAICRRQSSDGCGNNVMAFIEQCLAPAHFTQDHDKFNSLRDSVNQVLVLVGFNISENGKASITPAATSLDEAALRSNKLRAKLTAMGIHAEVLKSCRTELLKDRNFFHAVLEAAKGVSDRIRKLSGCTSDGAELVDDALAKGQRPFPILCLNSFRSVSEQSEQKGLCSLAKALVQLYRNPKAHDLKIVRDIDEPNALMAFQMASVVHSLLDRCTSTRSIVSNMQNVGVPTV